MATSKIVSSGLLLFRRAPNGLEVFLAHPGGPFWARRDEGAWTIPKGMVNPNEELLAAAVREFQEETSITPHEPFIPLGSIRQKAGKTVHGWAWEGDADPATITSNMTRTQWPRGSGHWVSYPEIDRCGWFTPDDARRKMNAAQSEFVARLEKYLSS